VGRVPQPVGGIRHQAGPQQLGDEGVLHVVLDQPRRLAQPDRVREELLVGDPTRRERGRQDLLVTRMRHLRPQPRRHQPDMATQRPGRDKPSRRELQEHPVHPIHVDCLRVLPLGLARHLERQDRLVPPPLSGERATQALAIRRNLVRGHPPRHPPERIPDLALLAHVHRSRTYAPFTR
jgi:hypothetical protein